MKNSVFNTMIFAVALVLTIAIGSGSFASELSTRYGYVGYEPEVYMVGAKPNDLNDFFCRVRQEGGRSLLVGGKRQKGWAWHSHLFHFVDFVSPDTDAE